jgi:hypothetical protein
LLTLALPSSLPSSPRPSITAISDRQEPSPPEVAPSRTPVAQHDR